MKEFKGLAKQDCLNALRMFITTFDRKASDWLAENDAALKKFLVQDMDLLSPPERRKLYVLLFGYFRQHYLEVVEARMHLEQNFECREILALVEKQNRVTIRQPYRPTGRNELLAISEKNLMDEDPGMRYLGALGVWTITKKSSKIVPILLKIVQDETSPVREESARLLLEFPLSEEALAILRPIAANERDLVANVVAEILNRNNQLS